MWQRNALHCFKTRAESREAASRHLAAALCVFLIFEFAPLKNSKILNLSAPLILCLKIKAHHEWRWLRPLERPLTSAVWSCGLQTEILASNPANGVFDLAPSILCLNIKAHHGWRWLRPLEGPLTSAVWSCGLQTEILPSNPANGVFLWNKQIPADYSWFYHFFRIWLHFVRGFQGITLGVMWSGNGIYIVK